MQLTYESTYQAYGLFVDGVDDVFTSNITAKQKLETDPHSYLSAGWIYTIGKKNHPYNAAKNNDFLEVTARINGGFNGFNDRKTKLTT
jgi:predicted chitinase